MKNILMIGGGVSGQAVSELAAALKIPCRVVSDKDVVAEEYPQLFENVDSVIVSPGVLPTSGLYGEAVKRNLPVISELEFGVRHFPGRMVAVTGTNGKTTTVELTTFLLDKLNGNVIAAGNIGFPLSAVSAQIVRGEIADAGKMIAVLEVSSFQLEHTYDLPAEAAVLLNVESDHINRYPGGMDEYRQVKERIFNQVPADKRFYGISMTGRAECAGFVIKNDELYFHDKKLLNLAETALSAPHNRENLMAALALTASVTELNGRENELIAAVKAFKTGDHRIALVGEFNGIKYIDDSKATNPAAVIAAVKSLAAEPARNIILIAGGLDKAMDFAPLGALAPYLRKVIVYGQCGKAVAAAFAGCDVEIFDARSNFALAVEHARNAAQPGDTVLLSPAAASMDMFKDYKERGNVFAETVRNLHK